MKAPTGAATSGWVRTCARSTAWQGVNFAVWAPNAESVTVVGEFNFWDGRGHAMRKLIPSGIWELFVPGIQPGALYKYRRQAARRPRGREVRSLWLRRRGAAAHGEHCRRTGLLINGTTTTGSTTGRNTTALDAPISIYEIAPGQLATRPEQPGPLVELSRDRPPAGRLLPEDGLHARRS